MYDGALKILHVVPTYLPATRYGGPIYSVHGLCKALVRKAHEVHVVTTSVDGPNDSSVPLGVATDLDGVKVWYFSSKIGRRLYWSSKMGQWLNRVADTFDLIHIHSVFLWPTLAASRAARKHHVPYLIAPRGMLVEDLIAQRGAFRKRAWIRLFERDNLARAAAIHFTADSELADFQRLGLEMGRGVIVPNGVEPPSQTDPSAVSEDVIQAQGPGGYVLFLSRISWKKGIERLLEAMVRLPAHRLVIVGNDEEGLLPSLLRLADSLGVSSRVAFVPRSVAGADKEALFEKAALFVLPSISENFGNVVLEAMARACPVVVTSEVGAKQVVIEAEAGEVVEGTPEALARGIRTVVFDSRYQKAGERGREFVSAHYYWDAVAGKMEEVYRDLRNERNG